MISSMVNNHKRSPRATIITLIGYLFIGTAGSIILSRHLFSDYLLRLVGVLFIHDGQLDVGPDAFKLILIGVGLLLLILGMVILFRQIRPFSYAFTFINRYFLNKDVRRFFFPPHCFLPQTYYLIIFWVTLLSSYLLIFLFRFHFSPLIEPLFMEDGILEWMTAVNLLLACIFLLASIVVLYRRKVIKINKHITLGIMVVLFLFCLFFLLEEISYGQRIFGWETQGVFEHNYQKETNLHNFFNPLMDDLANFAGTLLFFLLLFGWLRRRQTQSRTFRILFPHPSLFFMTASIFAITAAGQSDVMEEIFSIILVIYALTVWLILQRRPGTKSAR